MKKGLKNGEAKVDLAATYTYSGVLCQYHPGSQYSWP